MPERPLYLVVNRFDDECGDYHAFADGLDIDLAFITLPCGLGLIDRARSRAVTVVDDLTLDTVTAAAEAIRREHGPFAGAVGISEKDVLMMVDLRERLGVDGPDRALVERFKNKVAMKRALTDAGLRTPRFVALADLRDPTAEQLADRLVAELGLPVVLKPLAEGASRGVVEAGDAATLVRELGRVDRRGYEAEEYVAGDIFQVDGFFRDGACRFISSSVYVGTCLDFARAATPLGSVVLDEGERRRGVEEFALDCLRALGLHDGPFHLELIEEAPGRYCFLEVGLRPAGAETPHLHREHVGVDLFAEAFRVLLDLPGQARTEDLDNACGLGYLLVPEPRPLPNEVRRRTSLVGTVEHLYAEVLPEVGHRFTGDGGYDHIGGRFRFRSPGQAATVRAIEHVCAAYELEVVPC